MTVSKTDMLEAVEKIDHRITEVLYSWVKNEGNNLESFIDNPSGHVHYNPYVIMDFGKLSYRLQMLRDIEKNLDIITEYKKGNPDITKSMYEVAIDGTHVQLMERLLDWLNKRYKDMTQFISTSGNPDGTAPIDDYQGMFTFNIEKFSQEYTMYAMAIEGCKVVVQYKKEELVSESVNDTETEEPKVEENLLLSNEPPAF